MKTEKIVISFIASLIGILAAAAAFYFYQTTKVVPASDVRTITLSPKPEPTNRPSIFLTVDSPIHEDVTDKKTIIVNGTTSPDAVIIVTSSINDQVVTPSANGSFSTTIVVENDENEISITAVSPTGEEVTVIKTITVSTETF